VRASLRGRLAGRPENKTGFVAAAVRCGSDQSAQALPASLYEGRLSGRPEKEYTGIVLSGAVLMGGSNVDSTGAL
jgi:hypothetical protein